MPNMHIMTVYDYSMQKTRFFDVVDFRPIGIGYDIVDSAGLDEIVCGKVDAYRFRVAFTLLNVIASCVEAGYPLPLSVRILLVPFGEEESCSHPTIVADLALPDVFQFGFHTERICFVEDILIDTVGVFQ